MSSHSSRLISFAPVDEETTGDGARLRRAVLEELGHVVRTRLTPRQREIVEMYFYVGRTQEDIAVELGISQQAVSRQPKSNNVRA